MFHHSITYDFNHFICYALGTLEAINDTNDAHII